MAQTIQNVPQASPQSNASQRPVIYMNTIEAYNKWAEVYDTDGNFLQVLDTVQLRTLLPLFLDKVAHSQFQPQPQPQPQPTRLIDLGCGTGRNTLQLLRLAPADAEIIGLDASPGMLEVARATLARDTADRKRLGLVKLGLFDLLASPAAPPDAYRGASGVISTLVLEHIPLQVFFDAAAAVLRPGGFLLVTNMHSEMGAISQAGFVEETTGTKIRPTSYCHTVREVLGVAASAGFEIEVLDGEEVLEVRVDEEMAKVLGRRAEKWVNVKVWFGICFRKGW